MENIEKTVQKCIWKKQYEDPKNSTGLGMKRAYKAIDEGHSDKLKNPNDVRCDKCTGYDTNCRKYLN